MTQSLENHIHRFNETVQETCEMAAVAGFKYPFALTVTTLDNRDVFQTVVEHKGSGLSGDLSGDISFSRNWQPDVLRKTGRGVLKIVDARGAEVRYSVDLGLENGAVEARLITNVIPTNAPVEESRSDAVAAY